MTLQNLKDILFKKLKLSKECDMYMHLRNAGDETLSIILFLLNQIIDNINYLSSTQMNTAVVSIVYKGKNKPVHHHKSYRQVRVTGHWKIVYRLVECLKYTALDKSFSICLELQANKTV